MIYIISEASEASPSFAEWHVECDVCQFKTEPAPRPSAAVAASLEHQRRCRLITGQQVFWRCHGTDLGPVTPTLALGL